MNVLPVHITISKNKEASLPEKSGFEYGFDFAYCSNYILLESFKNPISRA
jgi:hypothetical protein